MPGGLLTHEPLTLSPGPPNGDLSAGLAGWTVQGRETPTPLAAGRGVRVRGNVTLVSPPVTVPAGAQVLRLALRAPGGGLVLVSARPEDGGPDVALGALEPGARRASMPVPLPPSLGGRAVRLLVDPVPAHGTSLEVHRVGPLVAPMPRWTASRGLLHVAGARGRRTVRVADARLRLTSPRYRPPAGARALLVDVRGDGVLRARAGGPSRLARARDRWRTIRVPLRPRARAVRLVLTATPGPGGLQLRRLGVAERPRR
ncbi:MAG TPA: hypothetical protein VFG74_14325 [Miltoncostaeaceae bacterium]|nr:hypothetical protein [Miltoncostaeaceae bacterium]